MFVYEQIGNTDAVVALPDSRRRCGRCNIFVTRPRCCPWDHAALYDSASIANSVRIPLMGV